MGTDALNEAIRLENLWSGQFGKDHMERNRDTRERHEVLSNILKDCDIDTVLEVGCNIGLNLIAIRDLFGPIGLYGIDIYEDAVDEANASGLKCSVGVARELEFPDSSIDLVFTAGVLIHQPLDMLEKCMSEIVRVSKKYVLAIEYFDPSFKEIPYRGNERALFKGDYGRMYMDLFPQLKLIGGGKIPLSKCWDDVTYWLFEKTS